MPKVSRNLALFENLKEESWFSVSMTILNRYHFFVCNGTFPKAKLRQLRGDILRPRLVDPFLFEKKIQLLVMKPKNRQFLHRSKTGSLKKYFVTHSSACNRIQTTPNVIIISIMFRESWCSYQAFLSRSVLSIVFFYPWLLLYKDHGVWDTIHRVHKSLMAS